MSNSAKVKELYSLISSINPKYKFFNNITPLETLLQNTKEDSKLITYALKDNISTKEHPLTCSSNILNGYKPNYDSTVNKLLKQQNNWINLGKLNLDEFGMGSGGVHSNNGVVINPLYDPITLNNNKNNTNIETRVAGGSSSGAAALCSAKPTFSTDNLPFERLAHFTLGTDTGGSVRLPAAWCNVLSFKPSYGRISRFGVLPYAQSLDTVGIISSDLNIISQVYGILDKFDEKDPTSMSKSLRKHVTDRDYGEDNDIISIGLIKEFNLNDIPKATKDIYYDFLQKLMEMNEIFEIKKVSVNSINNSLPIYFTLAPAEAASNLARFDGLRYGADGNETVERDLKEDGMFVKSRSLFGEEVQKRILLGNYNLSSELYDNKYKKAQVLRTELINDFSSVFKDEHPVYPTHFKAKKDPVDVIISLTSTDKTPLLSDFLKSNSVSPLDEFCNDIFTIPMSLAGLPVVSIPIKNTGISIQILGQFGFDEKVLRIAQKIENLLLK